MTPLSFPANTAPFSLPGGRSRDFAAGFRRLADPKITLASASSVLLGTAAAAAAGPLRPAWLALTLLGVFAVEVGKNASGEIYDWDSGCDRLVAEADRSPFSGGKRVLVDGLLDRAGTRRIALGAYVVATLCGLAIIAFREPAVLPLAAIGLALAFGYNAPPLRLAYRGFGELAVALCYGPGIACGTYLVQRGRIDRPVLLLSLPLGLLIAAFLVINEVPDADADTTAGKRNLVVRAGRGRAPRVFGAILVSAFLLLAALPAFGLPWTVLWGAVALLPAAFAFGTLTAHVRETGQIVPAQQATLAAFVAYAAAAAAALLLG